MRLEKPSIELKQQYLDMLEEWKTSGEMLVPGILSEDTSDFQALITKFENYSMGRGLWGNLVPNSTYLLVREDNKVLGAVNIRHQLNDSLKFKGGHIGYGIRPGERRKGYATLMLSMALDVARQMGMPSVMLTCDKCNIASAGTIVKSGGVLHSEDTENGEIFQRYWIELTQGEFAYEFT